MTARVGLFTSLLVVSFTPLYALILRHDTQQAWQNAIDAVQSKWHQEIGHGKQDPSTTGMSKSEADNNLVLSHHVGMSADSSSLAKDPFVAYSENGRTVNATAKYFFMYGSALGLYRDGENPRGDDDVDVAVPVWELPAVYDTLKKSWGVIPLENKNHWGSVGSWTSASFWGYAFNKLGTHICFGPAGAYYRDAYPVEMMLPVRKVYAPNIVALKGLQVNIPRNPKEVLPIIYGDSWRTPKQGYKGPPQPVFNKRYDENCAELMNGQTV